MDRKQFIPGQLYIDSDEPNEVYSGSTLLEFVKLDGCAIFFKWIAGCECYSLNKEGLIGFVTGISISEWEGTKEDFLLRQKEF